MPRFGFVVWSIVASAAGDLNVLPADRVKRFQLALFLSLLVVSCVRPPYPRELMLQHAPTLLTLAALWLLDRRRPLSRTSYGCLLAFLCLHLLGARYLYSFVPYDRWTESLFGLNLTERFGFGRNHYDRVVHFAYGLLLATPARRFATRQWNMRPFWSAATAVQFVLASSALYELAEWCVAIILAPDWADRYNGQQGDLWDAQKDMALALLGAVINVTAVALLSLWKLRAN